MVPHPKKFVNQRYSTFSFWKLVILEPPVSHACCNSSLHIHVYVMRIPSSSLWSSFGYSTYTHSYDSLSFCKDPLTDQSKNASFDHHPPLWIVVTLKSDVITVHCIEFGIWRQMHTCALLCFDVIEKDQGEPVIHCFAFFCSTDVFDGWSLPSAQVFFTWHRGLSKAVGLSKRIKSSF